MKNILKFGIISFSFAFGLVLFTANTASAQDRHATREYRKDVKEARKDYKRRVNNGDYAKARREYNEDIRDANREYVQNVRRDRNGWYYFQNNRRIYRPFASWNYRNGYFYRRY